LTQLIDSNTGLPAVPDGQFWKIVPATTAGYFRVQLRGKPFLGLSQTLGWTVVDSPLSDSKVQDAAFYVLDQIEQASRLTREAQQDAKYIGSYPPKKIGSK
jgi:hypothetical protein